MCPSVTATPSAVAPAAPTAPTTLVFPPAPGWVRAAREAVRTALVVARREELAPMALLLTSEIVTNAVNACRLKGCSTPVTVSVGWLSDGALLVLVYDDAPGGPTAADDARAVLEHEECGRGLLLVRACADGWGVCPPRPGLMGKAVWFRLVS